MKIKEYLTRNGKSYNPNYLDSGYYHLKLHHDNNSFTLIDKQGICYRPKNINEFVFTSRYAMYLNKCYIMHIHNNLIKKIIYCTSTKKIYD